MIRGPKYIILQDPIPMKGINNTLHPRKPNTLYMFRPIRQIFPLANKSTDMPNCQLGEQVVVVV